MPDANILERNCVNCR